ncbi:MAG: hypothetical protein ACOX1P_11100 [Thermoguttaceae bacterium]|jgi:hypothetical protein
MSNDQRADFAELMEVLAELHRRYPDWRLGQLVANVAGWADREIWDVEDKQLFEAARSHLHQSGAWEVESSRSGRYT